MANVEEVGIRLALHGRAEYLGGLEEAKRGLDGFGARAEASGKSMTTAARQTTAHRDAVKGLQRATSDAIASQRAYETALAEVAAAEREAGAVDTEVAERRKANAEASVAATRAQRDAALSGMNTAREGVKAEEDLAERTRLAGVKKVGAWEAFRTGVSRDAGAVSEATYGVAGAEAAAAAKIEAANARKVGAWRNFRSNAGLIAVGLGAVAGAVIGETTKMASTFDASMERIHTQAGVPQAAIAGLKQDVLGLAGKVGFDPDSLAEAMFHIQSSFAGAGLTAKQTSDILETAAQGAAMGGADLVDVTNAMDAAIVSGIPGVQNYQQAMGQLNATVGAGDMKMQDLANALGTGVLAVIKGYGATMRDASAALAVFGDNNIRGSLAGNQLRMSVQALTSPTKAGVAQLKELGLTQDALAKAMQHGGLNEAMSLLHGRMQKAGITGVQTGKWLTDAFGKRAGAGVSILMGQYDRFQQKLGEVDKGATHFAEDWSRTQDTAAQKSKEFHGALDALGIQMGNIFLPAVTKVTGWLGKLLTFFVQHKAAAVTLAVVIGTILVVAVVALGVALWGIVSNPVVLAISAIIIGVAALAFGIYELISHWSEVWGWITRITSEAWHAITGAVSTGWHAVTGFFANIGSDIAAPFVKLWDVVAGAVSSGWRKVSDFFAGAWAWIKGFFSQWGMTILMVLAPFIGIPLWIITHWDQVVDFFKKLPGRVIEFLGYLAGASVRFFIELPARIRAGLNNAGEWLRNTGRDILNGLIRGLTTAVSSVIEFFVLLPGRITSFARNAGHWLVDTGRDIIHGLFSAIVNNGVAVVQWFEKLPGRITSFGRNAGHWLIDTGRDIIHGLFTAIVNNAVSVVQWFEHLPGRVRGFFHDAGTWLRDTGRDILNGLIMGLANAVTAVYSWVLGMVDKFLTGFKHGLGIASPSKVFAGFGGDIINGLLNGLRNLVGMVVDFFVGFAKRLASGFRNEINTIVSVAKWLWDQLRSIFGQIGAVFRWLYDTFIQPVVNFISSRIRALAAIWRAFYTGDWSPIANSVGDKFRWIHDNIIRPVADLINRVIVGIGNGWRSFYTNVWQPTADSVSRVFTYIHDNVIRPIGDKINSVVHSIGQAFADAVDWIKRTWSTVADIVSVPVRFVVNQVYGHAIKPTWDAIAGVFGLPLAPAGPAFAEGGVVDDPQAGAPYAAANGRVMPGYEPGRDRYHILVGGGEAIMRPEWTRSMLRWHGPSAIDRANHAARSGQDPMLGHGHGHVDADRSRSATIGNLIAQARGPQAGGVRGGTHGGAFAEGGVFGADLPAVGLPPDPGAVSLGGAVLDSLKNVFDIVDLFTDPKAYLQGVFKPFTDPLGGMGGAQFMKAMQGVVPKTIDGMVGKIESAMSSMFGGPIAGGAAPPGQIKAWIDAALAILHWPMNYEAGIYQQIMTESSGNPLAQQQVHDVNSGANHAQGIMQVIPTTFRANALPGHGNILNPVDNIIAGSRYAMGKYGAAWFNPGPRHSHGYEGGGIVGVSGGVPFGGYRALGGPIEGGRGYVVGEGGPELVVSRTAAQVVPNDDAFGDSSTAEGLGRGRRGDVYVMPGAVVVNGATDPKATADMLADEIADRIARS